MFEHILVPLDGSPLAERVLPHVVAVASAFNSSVTLLRVLGRPSGEQNGRFVDPVNWHIKQAEAQAYLDQVAGRLNNHGIPVERETLEGVAAEAIIDFVQNRDVNLVILSSHGQSGLSGWNVSSTVQKVLLRVYRSILIVRAYQAGTEELGELAYRRLLVPLDGSQRAEYVLPIVLSLARFYNALPVLAHIATKPQIPQRMPLPDQDLELIERLTERKKTVGTEYLKNVQNQLQVQSETRLLVGEDTASMLHELAEQENFDLIMLSAHGSSGQPRWPYGSVATSFIAYGTTPLLIVQDLPQEEMIPSKAEVTVKERKGH